MLGVLLIATGCQADADPNADAAEQLAFTDEEDAATVGDVEADSPTTTAPPATTTTTAPPIPLGSPQQPFVELPAEQLVRAIRTPTDVILPVLGERDDTWVVMSACENIDYVPKSSVSGVDRAHVVLDPGHGGTEPGAVGSQGTTEKELNLAVALEASRLLTNLGAEVVLTRTTDHNVTTGLRGLLAKSIDPALFVSVHHNGGASRSGAQPGTIVFTKTGSEKSRRFGGLFYESLNAKLNIAAAAKQQAHSEYLAKLAEYESQVDAFDASVQARDAALLTNGQITETTVPAPAPVPVDGMILPRERNPIPTTTLPPATVPPTTAAPTPTTTTDGGENGGSVSSTTAVSTSTNPPQTVTTVPVPDTVPVPAPFVEPPVREFAFAGSGNRGVRAWTRVDGKDYLSVLRHSADVPAVLAEFLYLTNPSEEELLMDPSFIAAEGAALAEAVVGYFSSKQAEGSGFVDDQFDDQPIGGGGKPSGCVEPDYGLSGVDDGGGE